ncbi:MAG TPA: hypothetical protein VN868_00610 [Terriglobales bacterium]|jgi:hypothetical protein|nr:hypothetical protein [Terriglobales bacterium]
MREVRSTPLDCALRQRSAANDFPMGIGKPLAGMGGHGASPHLLRRDFDFIVRREV